MKNQFAADQLTEALARAQKNWHEQHGEHLPRGLTIAISRETGTFGAAIGHEVASRLGWPVYDRELVQRVADDMGVRHKSLDSVDEKRVGWLQEAMALLLAGPRVNDETYFRHLLVTLFSLAAHGNCVIVGRGAPAALPRASTLRVRLVASVQHRIDAIRRAEGITLAEATKRVKTTDEERDWFVTSHFGTDPKDAANFDLILNAERFSKAECAAMIIAAYERMRDHANSNEPAMAG